ncbi:MAG: chloride channel protein [Acidobacteriota bacterium]
MKPPNLWYQLQIRSRELFNRIPLRENQKVYVLTLLIGTVCGLAAVCFHFLLDYFQHHLIYRAAEIPQWWRVPLLLGLPLAGGLVAGAGLHFFAPEARGSGIPQIKAAYYLDSGRIVARVIPAKMLLASFNIGTGASLGREGPTVQICAALASLLGRMFAISRRRLQSLVPVGAAAGIAAAFNTPIAAVTFTLEEILGSTSARSLGSIVIASVIAAVIERSMLGDQSIFNVPDYRLNAPEELLFYALVGVVAGLAAAAFNRGLLRLRQAFLEQRSVPAWATPGVGGLVVGVLGLAGLFLTGSSSVFGVGYSQLSVELQGTLPLGMLVILGTLKLAATVVSYASGSSGGIFGPSLYIGGMLGGAVGLITQLVLHDAHTAAGAFALVGMGAMFAGVVRAPVTSIIIIFEMTNNYSLILPLMVANILGYVLASKFDPTPIYDALLKQDGIHLPQEQRHILKEMAVSSAMSREVVTVSDSLTVSQAFAHVQTLPVHHHAYPVVDKEGRLAGMFTFNDLKRALAAGRGNASVTQAASRNLVHAHPDHTLDTVMIKLGRWGVSQLPVVSRKDSRRLLGIITLHDVAESLGRQAKSGEEVVLPRIEETSTN